MTKTMAQRTTSLEAQPGAAGLPHAPLTAARQGITAGTQTAPTVQRAETQSAPGAGHDFAQMSVFPTSATPGVQRADDPANGPAVTELAALGYNFMPGMFSMSGVMQTDTIIANSVIGTSYTPGVGNLM